MRRREFLASVTAAISTSRLALGETPDVIETACGPLPLDKLGPTLMHEHVMVDFIGAGNVAPGRYKADEVVRVALPHLNRAYELGCRTLVECTPAYLGRDPLLLRRLSEASGLHIVTNAGYYAAGGAKYVPARVFDRPPGEIAKIWVSEFRNGIGDTGIRPGFIKIGVDRSPLSGICRTLAQAAGTAHQDTGLTIASHTGDGAAAMEQLDILKSEGVSANAFIWVHAQSEKEPELHLKAAERGAWVEFDGIDDSSIGRHVDLVKSMIARGYLGQTLISMDAGWYHVGEPGGGIYRGYGLLFDRFLPAMRRSGVSEGQIRALLVDNPRRALRPALRRH